MCLRSFGSVWMLRASPILLLQLFWARPDWLGASKAVSKLFEEDVKRTTQPLYFQNKVLARKVV